MTSLVHDGARQGQPRTILKKMKRKEKKKQNKRDQRAGSFSFLSPLVGVRVFLRVSFFPLLFMWAFLIFSLCFFVALCWFVPCSGVGAFGGANNRPVAERVCLSLSLSLLVAVAELLCLSSAKVLGALVWSPWGCCRQGETFFSGCRLSLHAFLFFPYVGATKDRTGRDPSHLPPPPQFRRALGIFFFLFFFTDVFSLGFPVARHPLAICLCAICACRNTEKKTGLWKERALFLSLSTGNARETAKCPLPFFPLSLANHLQSPEKEGCCLFLACLAGLSLSANIAAIRKGKRKTKKEKKRRRRSPLPTTR